MFVALEPRRLYRQAAEQLRTLIEAGEVRPGERLPAERELAERLGVSRPTIREALIVLEVEGLIQIRMGSGVYVSARSNRQPEILAADDSDGPFEILQARCLIESAIAEEAARKANSESIAKLNSILAEMEGSLDDSHQALALDRAFHTAIADMIGNSALNRFTGLIYDKRLSPYFTKLASYFEGPHTWKAALEEHKIIRDALAAGNPADAREAMRQHLTLSQKRFSESFGEEPTRND
ncbi:FadR family transcriptional regulator [Rhizobium sp. CFBP 13726]|uniref:FadR/GntR family transcriptional regulator n=1 Tax=Rhizobium sp. CFBP 13726 TaxID=2775296 RepID=UPI00177D1275|nr:FadR/GntR family transcriptional regulator [Rhizobium sp. CFBP 13726]MBD8652196.1 FadR family transcriptional regulator [Rhizobium sp. CFBP 13726]